MSDYLGYLVIEYNQASHAPGLEGGGFGAFMYDTEEEAEERAQWLRSKTADAGRREQFAVAAVDLTETYEEEGPR